MAKKKEQKHSVPKITAKIDRMTNPDAKIKAYASVNIGDAFVVNYANRRKNKFRFVCTAKGVGNAKAKAC